MGAQLRVSLGRHSDQGRKACNQDFLGACVPKEPLLASKGVAVALADGISSSEVSHLASRAAVAGFLEDYYCTPESWSVKTAIEKVLKATNSWLHAQSRHGRLHCDLDRGYVCTLSAVVFKSHTAHLFHVGDSRIYQLRGGAIEQLTEDHRLHVAPGQSYLSRALGMRPQLDIDYRALPVEPGDIFMLTTDGVHEYVDRKQLADIVAVHADDLDAAARAIVAEALRLGSNDNLSVQLARADALPAAEAAEMLQQMSSLPFPPALEARMEFDGYRMLRELHASHRSHVWLAQDLESGTTVVIKTLSVALRDDARHVERFLLEEWIARRIDSAHVLKPWPASRRRSYLYLVMEFVEGQTLEQWMVDNPRPPLDKVRAIVEQIARGLRAFHRLEMLHQDLRPANIMIDASGTVKIIDFGAARVAGVEELQAAGGHDPFPGTAQYMAPEYFLGEPASSRSDMFSLAVIAYHMLTGVLPYGAAVAQARTRVAQRRLQYRPALSDDSELPAWVDEALRRALHPDPWKRYTELSEFLFDLHQPNKEFLNRRRQPLIDRNPIVFWKGVSLLLALTVLALLAMRA